jgi:hypothetical protein
MEGHKDPPPAGSTVKKKVDDSWKESVRREKASFPSDADLALGPEVDFPYFLSTLGMQALLALGEAAHPATGQKTADLAQARTLIDILQLLSEKTRGNLAPEEAEMLKGLIYELQMKFVQKTQGSPPPHAD